MTTGEQNSATPGVPPVTPGASLNQSASHEGRYANDPLKQTGDAPATPGVPSANGLEHTDVAKIDTNQATPRDARANGYFKDYNQLSDDEWATLSDAEVKTVNDTRLYLFDVYDIFFSERFTQKLVSDKSVLTGRKVPKREGGGRELKIAIPTIDAYAAEIERMSLEKYGDKVSHKWHGSKITIDPDDRIFEQLREIARTKPYAVAYSGDAERRPATPVHPPQSATFSQPQQVDPPIQNDSPVEPIAGEGETKPSDPPLSSTVPREMYDLANTRGDEYRDQLVAERAERKEEREKHYQHNQLLMKQLEDTTDKLSEASGQLAELALKQPVELLAGFRGLVGLHPEGQTVEVIKPRSQPPEQQPVPPTQPSQATGSQYEQDPRP